MYDATPSLDSSGHRVRCTLLGDHLAWWPVLTKPKLDAQLCAPFSPWPRYSICPTVPRPTSVHDFTYYWYVIPAGTYLHDGLLTGFLLLYWGCFE